MAPTASQSTKPSVWLQLYFVLATLIGLICVVVGASSLVNTVLTSTVLQVKQPKYNMPPQPAIVETKSLTESDELTPEQKQRLAQWEQEYKLWETEQREFDYEAENRKRSLAFAIAMLVTGLPVFALHAPIVFRSFKKE